MAACYGKSSQGRKRIKVLGTLPWGQGPVKKNNGQTRGGVYLLLALSHGSISAKFFVSGPMLKLIVENRKIDQKDSAASLVHSMAITSER